MIALAVQVSPRVAKKLRAYIKQQGSTLDTAAGYLIEEGLRIVDNRSLGASALNAKLTAAQRTENARKGGLAKAARAAERAQ